MTNRFGASFIAASPTVPFLQKSPLCTLSRCPVRRHSPSTVASKPQIVSNLLPKPGQTHSHSQIQVPVDCDHIQSNNPGRPQNGTSSASKSTMLTSITNSLQTFTNLFPLWVLIGAAMAYAHPPSFLWFRSSYVVPTLATIMLGMGLTITPSSFVAVANRPRSVFLGVLAQYTIMPSLGLLASRLTNLPSALAAGVILVCVCPGGAASNVVCLLAGADVALSVVLTLCSTILSTLAIPFLMYTLAGALVPVDPSGLFISTAQIVLFPLILGLFIRLACRGSIPSLVFTVLPLISVLGVTFICGGIVAANAYALTTVAPQLITTLALVHTMGGVLGFLFARIFRMERQASRTVAVEVMMQNSSLAVTLANTHFANPVTAIPGAISATLHSILGSLLAGFWRLADSRSTTDSEPDRIDHS